MRWSSQQCPPTTAHTKSRACCHSDRLRLHINVSATTQQNTPGFGRSISYLFIYQSLMCADGEQAYGSKIIFPKPQRKLGPCPGLEQSLEQILGPASVNLAGFALLLIHLFSPAFKNAWRSQDRLPQANISSQK